MALQVNPKEWAAVSAAPFDDDGGHEVPGRPVQRLLGTA